MILSYFKHYLFYTFNVNEHQAVQFVELPKGGPSPFLLFTQDYLSDHFHSHTSLILLIA